MVEFWDCLDILVVVDDADVSDICRTILRSVDVVGRASDDCRDGGGDRNIVRTGKAVTRIIDWMMMMIIIIR